MNSIPTVSAFEMLLLSFGACFTAPTRETFAAVAVGWVLCMGRPTVRRIVASAGELATKHESTYHRFFRKARWCIGGLCEVLFVRVVVPFFAPTGKIVLAGDDTTCHKYGRRVAHAGYYRDAVRSTAKQTVVHWAHNWVVVTMQARFFLWPWRVIPIPVMLDIYRKADDCDEEHPFRTRNQILVDIAKKVANWLPDREFELVADGAYACEDTVEGLPANFTFTSRIRRDAAIFGPPQPVTKRRRGRPAQKGARLPKLAQIARTATWNRRVIVMYGRRRVRLLYSFRALWWKVSKATPVQVVIVRDPSGHEKDDYFFTTDLSMDPAHLVEIYSARWGVEEAIRDGKQVVGMDDVQGWSPTAVERQAPFAMLILALVKVWYLKHVAPQERPEALPSTASMLARLRMAFWQRRISAISAPRRETRKLAEALGAVLSAAS